MRSIIVIGIGAGNPDYLTVQAITALNEASVFFVVDKGDTKADLLDLRAEICRRFIDGDDYRIVSIEEPARDRGAAGYRGAVSDWHAARAARFEEAILSELPEDGCGAFLVWGDPCLYDSTLRVIDRILANGRVGFDYRVVPGITSVQALAAEHRIPLNRIGEPVHITTGRRIADGMPAELDAAVVMLDAGLACAGLADPELEIFWGAFLGTPDQVVASGRVVEVAAEIAERKRRLRAEHGWIMDTYLLRRPERGGEPEG